MEVREDENATDDHVHQSPTPAAKNGDVITNGLKQKAGAHIGNKVIVSHSPEGSTARVVSSLDGSVSRLSSVGSGYSYSVSPDGSSMSRPASDVTGLRQVSSVCHCQCVILDASILIMHTDGSRTLGSQPTGNISHRPGSRLLLLSTRLVVIFPATGNHHCLASTKLYWLVT